MEIKNLISSEEERAVSPVIGVILMVAITVILAAVIGTFVLGLGDQVQTTAPNAQFSFDFSDDGGDAGDDVLTITHEGGDGIEAGEVAVRGDVSNPGSLADRAGPSDSEYAADDKVRAGSSVTVQGTTNGEDFHWDNNDDGTADPQAGSDATVRVVWEDADSDQSSTLRTWNRE